MRRGRNKHLHTFPHQRHIFLFKSYELTRKVFFLFWGELRHWIKIALSSEEKFARRFFVPLSCLCSSRVNTNMEMLRQIHDSESEQKLLHVKCSEKTILQHFLLLNLKFTVNRFFSSRDSFRATTTECIASSPLKRALTPWVLDVNVTKLVDGGTQAMLCQHEVTHIPYSRLERIISHFTGNMEKDGKFMWILMDFAIIITGGS